MTGINSFYTCYAPESHAFAASGLSEYADSFSIAFDQHVQV